jgi:hypothetical protein
MRCEKIQGFNPARAGQKFKDSKIQRFPAEVGGTSLRYAKIGICFSLGPGTDI